MYELPEPVDAGRAVVAAIVAGPFRRWQQTADFIVMKTDHNHERDADFAKLPEAPQAFGEDGLL